MNEHSKPIATTAGISSDPNHRGPRVIVQIIGSCPKCGQDSLKVTRTVGVVRYLKCDDCGGTTKATPQPSDVHRLIPSR